MKLLATLLATFLTLGVHAQGLIWTVNRTSIGGNPEGAGPMPNREIAFDHVSDSNSTTPPSLNPVSRIFAIIISTNDSGRTFLADSQNEPGFLGFVAGITDGSNSYIRSQLYLWNSSWGVGSEANVLGRSLATPDLAGYNITQIGFRVNSYYDWFYEPENRYLNTLDYSLDFYGAPVPEPSTWALLGLGGATALLLRRKARQRL